MTIKHNDTAAGFTLIEMLVVVSILTLLTSFLILYNRGGERQIILLREKAKLINTILRAKSLALNTFIQKEKVCGYGVAFEGSAYFIYQDLPGISGCFTDPKYSGSESEEKLENEVFVLDTALKFQREIDDILFIPPEPKVFLNGELPPFAVEKSIILSTLDENLKTSIIINNAGQVSSQ